MLPQQPHTEQQYRKWGSTIPEYKVFKEAIGRKFLACFRNPIDELDKAIKQILESHQWLECNIDARKVSDIINMQEQMEQDGTGADWLQN